MGTLGVLVRHRACAGLLAGAMALAGAVGSGGCSEAPAPERAERRHASLDTFRDASPSGGGRRVALIGLDGASWAYLDPLLAKGELPNLARLVAEGARGTLRSVECHFTPPAWTTMLTGQPPSRHGIYSFGRWDRAETRFHKVSSNDVQAPFVWDVASRVGRRVAVTSVPVTFPAYPVEGTMVSGIMTPKRHREPLSLSVADARQMPPRLRPESEAPLRTSSFEDALNVLHAGFFDSLDDAETRFDQVRVATLKNGIGPIGPRLLSVADFPVGEFSPWLEVRVPGDAGAEPGFVKLRFESPGTGSLAYQLSPTFQRLDHPFTYPGALAEEIHEELGFYLPHEFLTMDLLPRITADAIAQARYFLEKPWDLYLYVFGQSDNAHHLVGFAPEVLPIYRQLDAFLGEVLDAIGDDTTLFVTSDHGFGRFDHAIDLNQLFARLGLLAWEREGVIDHANTVVFHNMWHLHFAPSLVTREALAERGITVGPDESPRAALERTLVEAAGGIRAPDGRALPVVLEPMPADAATPAPDMAVMASEEAWIEFWNVDRPNPAIVSALEGDARWKHARDGIFLARGPGVPAGARLGTLAIADVGPTLLDRLGLPVAEDLAGEPIALGGAHPLERVASYGELGRDAVPVPEDPASFEETLRALGYVRD